jgi:parallel beta-helix repeat protein
LTLNQKTSDYIEVDINGSGDYKSIQKAVYNAKSGSTIYIKNGEYSEIIEIKKQVTLIGEDKDKTLINPISEKNKYAVLLGVSGVKITGLSVQNRGSGIYASSVRITASNTEIQDCNFYDTPIGIVLWTSNNLIQECSFWGCTDEGIALIGSSYSKCENNRIIDCVFYDNCDGIELQYSSRNTISNCKFYDNTHTGIDAIASSNNENVISNCEIYNNQVHGIYMSGSHENQIVDCEVYDNHEDDIVFNEYSKDNTIIYPAYNEEQKEEDTSISVKTMSIRTYLENLLDKISSLKSSRISEFLNSIRF